MKKINWSMFRSILTLLSFAKNEMTEAQLKSIWAVMIETCKYQGFYVLLILNPLFYDGYFKLTARAKKNTGKMEIYSPHWRNFV